MAQLSGTIAFASGKTGDYDIWTCDLESGQLTQLTSGDSWNDKPKWSPCGEWIVFVSNRTASSRTAAQEIFKVPATGGEPLQLTDLNRWTDSPCFSPDGRLIAYVSNEAGNNDIWVMDTDGGNRRQVTTDGGADEHVEWTADGEGLVWASDRNGDANIFRYSFATEEITQLNQDRGSDFAPAVSPDGALVAFCSNRQEHTDEARPFSDRDKDLWLMGIDGKFPVKLTQNQGADFSPSWSPCGQHLIYCADGPKQSCHLRVLDIADVVEAFASGDGDRIEQAAGRVRSEAVQLERDALEGEIDAKRNATFVTALLPDSWVKSLYPAEYFGLERNPHWSAVSVSSLSGVATV